MNATIAGAGGADTTATATATEQSNLTVESLSFLREGISLVFSRWTALQLAMENGWGGRDTRHKVQQLEDDVISWFTNTRGPLYIDDLENMLDVYLVDVLNTVLEDGSIEEKAEQLMILHEDCLNGHFESVQRLRESGLVVSAVSQNRQAIDDDDEDDDGSSDDEASDMTIDEPKPIERAAENPRQVQMPDADGWSVVTSRRNKGRKS